MNAPSSPDRHAADGGGGADDRRHGGREAVLRESVPWAAEQLLEYGVRLGDEVGAVVAHHAAFRAELPDIVSRGAGCRWPGSVASPSASLLGALLTAARTEWYRAARLARRRSSRGRRSTPVPDSGPAPRSRGS